MNLNAKGTIESASLEAAICQHPFLTGMSPHQYRILSDCAMPRRFETNEMILREGDPADRFYLLRTGQVTLESHDARRGTTRIQTIGAGDVLGWSWLFPPYLWHFDARALEPTEAIFFYATPLREECESDHELGYELTKRMAELMLKRLQGTRRRLLELSSTSI